MFPLSQKNAPIPAIDLCINSLELHERLERATVHWLVMTEHTELTLPIQHYDMAFCMELERQYREGLHVVEKGEALDAEWGPKRVSAVFMAVSPSCPCHDSVLCTPSSYPPHTLLIPSSYPPHTLLKPFSCPHTLLLPSSYPSHTLLVPSSCPPYALLMPSSCPPHTLLMSSGPCEPEPHDRSDALRFRR